MSDLFDTGIRPHVDAYLLKKSQEKRDYGKYWSASSAGYCMRKLIFERLGVPPVVEDARKTRVFESGHIFHEWMQRITKDAGLSVAQELELQDEDLMVRGHIDDLILIDDKLILYDFKTAHSKSFHWAKKNGSKLSHFHRFQLGTYMYMMRKGSITDQSDSTGLEILQREYLCKLCKTLEESRICKISKDDLCLDETQLLWSKELETDVVQYWKTLQDLWVSKKIPKCTCADHEGGFMAREAYNPFFYEGDPCSMKWLQLNMKNIKEKN